MTFYLGGAGSGGPGNGPARHVKTLAYGPILKHIENGLKPWMLGHETGLFDVERRPQRFWRGVPHFFGAGFYRLDTPANNNPRFTTRAYSMVPETKSVERQFFSFLLI